MSGSLKYYLQQIDHSEQLVIHPQSKKSVTSQNLKTVEFWGYFARALSIASQVTYSSCSAY